MATEERTKTYLVRGLQNWLAFLTPDKLDLNPDAFEIEYLTDVPGGALIKIVDPVLGKRVFEIKVVQRKNLGAP